MAEAPSTTQHPLDAAAAAPTGAVTLAFTDIEGSTPLWERLPTEMSAALGHHNALIRDLLARHGGYEVRTIGDAFMVAFQAPLAALAWALDVVAGLAQVPWRAVAGSEFPELKVRIGLHSGTPELVRSPGSGAVDYLGSVVNRAARISAAGHGGQILVSRDFWEGLTEAEREALPARAVDLGEYVLRGLVGSEHIVQVVPVGAPVQEFPALRTQLRRRSNLDPERDAYIGRAEDIAQIQALLHRGERLITLLGPGGVGKTRLSQRIGGLELERGRWSGGVWFCDLSSVTDDSGLIREMAHLFSVPLDPRRSVADSTAQIGHALEAMGAALIILDNCEQLTAAVRRAVEVWRSIATKVTFLVTSREPLRLRGERCVRLAPLTVKDGAALFLARVEATGVDASDYAEADVLRLVEHLEGLPLAIELASARAGVLDPPALLRRLAGVYPVLRDDSGARPVRHSTLRLAIAWSWDLLSEQEQRMLAMLSVFRGSFSEGDVAALWQDPHEFPSALDLLQSLLERSLLVARPTPPGAEGPRFDMLQSIRAFAEERLEDAQGARERHARRLGARCAEVLDQDQAAPGPVALARFAGDQANLLAVHQRFRTGGPCGREAVRATLILDALIAPVAPVDERRRLLDGIPPETLDLAAPAEQARHLLALAQAERDLGHLAGAEARLRDALTRLGGSGAPRLRCELIRRLGDVLCDQERRAEGRLYLDEALALAERNGDLGARGWVHTSLGVLAVKERALDRALEHHQQALRDARASGDGRHEAKALLNLGVVLRERGDLGGAQRMAAEAATRLAAMGETRAHALAMNNLGIVAGIRGDLPEARRCFEGALGAARANGLATLEGAVRNNLAQLALLGDQLEDAAAHAERALSIHLGADDAQNAAVSRGLLAQVLLLRDDNAGAALVLTAAVDALERQGRAHTLWMHYGMLAASRAGLGEHEAAADLLGRARGALAPPGDPTALRALVLLEAQVGLARGGREAALGLLGEPGQGAASSPELIFARRLLERSLDRGAPAALA